MKILARNQDDEIMKLIGASDWFIRWPFILEGIFYGVVSAFFAWVSAYTLLLYSTPLLLSWLGDLSLLPVPFWFMFVLLQGALDAGALVGFFGSLMAVRRFLRR